jgi:hypothetical protein
MVQPILFAAALLGVCAAANPLFKKDDSIPCFDATIRKEFLLQITTYEPSDPYTIATNNFNQIRLHVADPTNQDQNAITCTTASWNSTYQAFPTDYLTCSDPTISYKLTSYTDLSTFSLIFNQTFVQGAFSETVLASYNATKSDLNGYACYPKGCNAYYQSVRTHSIQATFRQITYTLSHRAAKGMQSCTTSRRTAHHRPPSPTSVHQLLCPRHPTGQSDTVPKAPKIPQTRLPPSQAPSASTF